MVYYIKEPMKGKFGMKTSAVKIVIETENSAFQYGNKQFEVCRILKRLISDIESGLDVKSLLDINGNVVGSVKGLNK